MAARTSLLLLLLLLLAPPDSSAASEAGLIPKLKFFEKSISAIEEVAGYYLEEKEEGVKDVSGEQSSADDRQLGSSAANSYGALIFDLPVGSSPPQVLPFVMDITTDLVWAQCGKPGPTYAPNFRPNRSDSFSPIGCADPACSRLMPKYKCAGPGDRCGGTSAFLATDTFIVGTTPAKGVVFGCIGKLPERNLNSSFGSAGFSRGPLSLVSQLHISRFSYFIDDDGGGDKSFVSFSVGDDAAPAKDTGSRSTPLIKGKHPELYYVKLTGVQVDGELLKDIPEETFSGSGGVILSTTLPVTYLEQAAYKVLRQKLLTKILYQKVVGLPKSPDEDRLCFPTKEFAAVKVPTVALVFDGTDAAMELNVKNYFFDVAGSDQTCLTIRPSTGGSVLGSLLQTGRNMTYDIHDDGGVLTFGPAAVATKGGAPAPAQASLVTVATLLLLGWVLIF